MSPVSTCLAAKQNIRLPSATPSLNKHKTVSLAMLRAVALLHDTLFQYMRLRPPSPSRPAPEPLEPSAKKKGSPAPKNKLDRPTDTPVRAARRRRCPPLSKSGGDRRPFLVIFCACLRVHVLPLRITYTTNLLPIPSRPRDDDQHIASPCIYFSFLLLNLRLVRPLVCFSSAVLYCTKAVQGSASFEGSIFRVRVPLQGYTPPELPTHLVVQSAVVVSFRGLRIHHRTSLYKALGFDLPVAIWDFETSSKTNPLQLPHAVPLSTSTDSRLPRHQTALTGPVQRRFTMRAALGRQSAVSPHF